MQIRKQQLPPIKIPMGSIRLYPGQFENPENIGKLARSLGDFLGDKKKIPHKNIYLRESESETVNSTNLLPTPTPNHASWDIFALEEKKPLKAPRPQILKRSKCN